MLLIRLVGHDSTLLALIVKQTTSLRHQSPYNGALYLLLWLPFYPTIQPSHFRKTQNDSLTPKGHPLPDSSLPESKIDVVRLLNHLLLNNSLLRLGRTTAIQGPSDHRISPSPTRCPARPPATDTTHRKIFKIK